MAEEKKMPSAEKLKALQLAMAKIDKDFGKGAIMRLGENKVEDVPVIPTGSVGLNIALGVGGYPRGRVIEIYGPESSGKTTLAIHAMAEVQKQGGIAAIIDAEHAFDRRIGVDKVFAPLAVQVYVHAPPFFRDRLDAASSLVAEFEHFTRILSDLDVARPQDDICGRPCLRLRHHLLVEP